MRAISVLIAGLSAAMLFLMSYAFAPWDGNLLGDAAIGHVPLWIVCMLLARGLGIDTALRLRTMRRPPA